MLLKDPEIVILDEATAHLDGPARADILSVLETALAGRTVVTIAHDLISVAHADRIFVLNAGSLTESGTHAELMAARGLYRRLFELQGVTRDSAAEPQ